jgi:pyruvate/2-oxoglutarate dehydrogenase complex dihydrolipoamide acyltransferase (E2) component
MERERYEVRPYGKLRRAYADVLEAGHRQHTIHGLIEVDVDRAWAASSRAEPPLSFTGYVAWCVARAVAEDPMMHAHRWGRRRLVLFSDVDVNVQIEQVDPDGGRRVQSTILRTANTKSVRDLSNEIRAAQRITETDRERLRATTMIAALPRVVRRALWAVVMRRPHLSKRLGGTVAVSSVGMFGSSLGWGIPIAPAPLMVTVGGIGPRPVEVGDQWVSHDHLSLTISVDHDVIDGAPAARFVRRLRELIESGRGLDS